MFARGRVVSVRMIETYKRIFLLFKKIFLYFLFCYLNEYFIKTTTISRLLSANYLRSSTRKFFLRVADRIKTYFFKCLLKEIKTYCRHFLTFEPPKLEHTTVWIFAVLCHLSSLLVIGASVCTILELTAHFTRHYISRRQTVDTKNALSYLPVCYVQLTMIS